MDDPPHSRLPTPRATKLFARTVFRQLRRAAYSRAEILALINDLVDLVIDEYGDDSDEKALKGTLGGALSGITDPQSRLANMDVLLEAISFEMHRASDTSGTLLLLALEVSVPPLTPDDTVQRLHEQVASQLPRAVRPHDVVGRAAGRFVIGLPGAQPDAAEPVVRRLMAPLLAPRRVGDQVPEGTTIHYRVAVFDGSAGAPSETADQLLARTMSETPTELGSHSISKGSNAISISYSHDTTHPISNPNSNSKSNSKANKTDPNTNEVVLALGGGAARAAAHIGVLKALRLGGVEVTGIAGTSAGALVGAMSLLGMTEDAILERFESYVHSPTYKRMRRLFASYRRASHAPRATIGYFRQSGLSFISNADLAAIDDETFEAFIEHFVGEDRDISALRGRFAVASTDLTSGRTVVLTSGPLHFALRASCAVPGLFRPQVQDALTLVDGATIAEVPVHAAHALGLDAPVVAVHLLRPDLTVPSFVSSAEVVTRTASLMHTELVREQLRHAPALITAPVGDVGWLDFRNARETVAIGFEAAQTYLAKRNR